MHALIPGVYVYSPGTGAHGVPYPPHGRNLSPVRCSSPSPSQYLSVSYLPPSSRWTPFNGNHRIQFAAAAADGTHFLHRVLPTVRQLPEIPVTMAVRARMPFTAHLFPPSRLFQKQRRTHRNHLSVFAHIAFVLYAAVSRQPGYCLTIFTFTAACSQLTIRAA